MKLPGSGGRARYRASCTVIIQILSRRTKNNPVLIGEPGVGKTAIIESLWRQHMDNGAMCRTPFGASGC